MGPLTRHKRPILLALILVLGLMITGCATIPPEPITGSQPTQAPTDAPEETTAPEGEGATLAPEGEGTTPTATAAARSNQPSIAPQTVELFYSGMPSLMGFADAHQTTIYENTMDALPALVSLCWPSATTTYYRYGADISKDDMRLGKEQLLARVGDPSFYRDTELTEQPARLKREGLPLISDAVKMNEPIRSFYDVMGLTPPAARSTTSGTPVAVAASDPAETSLTVIVTDLHELRMDDGALLTALNERSLQVGRTVGVAAISSEFAGYIPNIGSNNTTYVWGSPPTGTLDFTLDYTDYKVGVSIDPEQREMASRPFYVLVIGDQGAVNTYLEALSERLTREFAGNATFKMNTAVFGSGYVPADYELGGNMRYLAGQGVTAIAEPSAPGGVNLIELKASQQQRFLEWQVDYTIHPADPRGVSLTAEDFTFIAQAVGDSGTTVLPQLTWQIVSAEGSNITLSLRLELPAGVLPQGSYTLEILGSLAAPATLPGSDWLATFGYDADGAQLFDMEQNTVAFDGSRTLYLSRLIDTLGKANIGRLGVASLGTVSIQLTVYA